jgi:hypothetical protein
VFGSVDDEGITVGIGDMSFVLAGAPQGWIRRVKLGRASCLPRSGTTRRP